MNEQKISILQQLVVLYQKLISLYKYKEMNKIETIVKAMAEMEGYGIPGARPTRNNNPLNLTYTPYTAGLGAVGKDGRFCIFATPQLGFKAGHTFLRDAFLRLLIPYHIFSSTIPYHKKLLPNGHNGDELPDLTFYDFISIFAPREDNNSPEEYADYVIKKVAGGLTRNTLVKTLL